MAKSFHVPGVRMIRAKGISLMATGRGWACTLSADRMCPLRVSQDSTRREPGASHGPSSAQFTTTHAGVPRTTADRAERLVALASAALPAVRGSE
jgi:hypothetical protein